MTGPGSSESSQPGDKPRVILDTNILVAAGFNPGSHSAEIVNRVRAGLVEMAWDVYTRSESRRTIERIPRLPWERFAGLFNPSARYDGATRPERFRLVQDPDDRKFAALAEVTGAALITNDEHLLSVRDRLEITVLTPAEFVERTAAQE